MTTILVTGGAGYIGSHTCKILAAEGYTPIVYDNLSEGHREFVKWGELIEGDVRDTARLERVLIEKSPLAVIHFAASAAVGVSIRQPQNYYENNLVGSLSLLAAMRVAACQNIVFSSTCAVYGRVTHLPINIGQNTEPVNPYGRTKLAVEQVLSDCADAYRLNSVSLRYFNAAGADMEGEIGERHIPETHLIPNVINAALGKSQVLELFGDDYNTPDGTCVRDYVHVSDLANAHLLAVKYLTRHRGAHKFNLGAGVGCSVKQVIDLVEKQLGKQVPLVVKARRPGDPAVLYADVSHTKEILGWEPFHSDMHNIISSAINWARTEDSHAVFK